MFEQAEEHARESGRDDSAMTRVMHLFLCFSGSAEESAEIASGVFTRRYGSSTTVPADAPHLLGTPDQMREMVQEVRGRRGDGVCDERRVSAGRGDIAG